MHKLGRFHSQLKVGYGFDDLIQLCSYNSFATKNWYILADFVAQNTPIFRFLYFPFLNALQL